VTGIPNPHRSELNLAFEVLRSASVLNVANARFLTLDL
jgi:hypothetical protein